MTADRAFEEWLGALDDRYLADLTPSEAARALRALSSCYVERRAKLVQGGALDSAGKRAAFALFYGPLHYLVVRELVGAIPGARSPFAHLLDLGCGTGAAGIAWALAAAGSETIGRLHGVDRHPWAVAEANWAYGRLGLDGRARRGDAAQVTLRGERGGAILAAYTVNEMPEAARQAVLPRLLHAHADGARVLVVEPIARRMSSWWDEWAHAFTSQGGSAGEWRFPVQLPPRQRDLARAAGLDPRELTARTLWLPGDTLQGRA